MSLTPAHDEQQIRRKKEAVELCGKNRGPHDYIPIEFNESEISNGVKIKRVTRILCRTCFANVSIKNLLDAYPEAIPYIEGMN